MIIEIPDDNSIVKWRYKDNEDWKSAEISDLIKAYERPQGDLISREALKETIIKVCGKCSNNITEYDENHIPNGNCAIWHILNMIDNAPTVERPQGEWIPVEDKLPKDMQRVLIWFEYYRYGDFNCMYQTYGFGYVCDGKWSPFINGETGWQDYRVIAWQSLPEPYKKGGAE